MGIWELLLIAVGLSMDAFAAAVCQGLSMPKLRRDHAAIIALFFGAFQALMPLAGWFLGVRFAGAIEEFDHWIAFFLLLFIGGKMALESRKTDEGAAHAVFSLNYRELLVMAVATSIDALAVGITFALLTVPIVPAVLFIGATTFVISFAGVVIGNYFGQRWRSGAELLGGVILMAIGTKILLEHLGILHI